MNLIETGKPHPEVVAAFKKIEPDLEGIVHAQSLVLSRVSKDGDISHFIARYVKQMPSRDETTKTALVVSREQVEVRYLTHPANRSRQ